MVQFPCRGYDIFASLHFRKYLLVMIEEEGIDKVVIWGLW
jgi:hypothetical protein